MRGLQCRHIDDVQEVSAADEYRYLYGGNGNVCMVAALGIITSVLDSVRRVAFEDE